MYKGDLKTWFVTKSCFTLHPWYPWCLGLIIFISCLFHLMLQMFVLLNGYYSSCSCDKARQKDL